MARIAGVDLPRDKRMDIVQGIICGLGRNCFIYPKHSHGDVGIVALYRD